MPKVNAYYLSLKDDTPNDGYWDYGFVDDFITGGMWHVPNQPELVKKTVRKLPKNDRAIVLIPARHHAGMEAEINKELAKIKHVVLFLMGDEEADFAVEEIEHDSIHIWVQNPHPNRHDNYNRIGTGYPPQARAELKKHDGDKPLDLFFSGQITHIRRRGMLDNILWYRAEKNSNTKINATKGFTQGMAHKEYYSYMAKAKVVPAPSGAVIPDSFRLFEALESMAMPLADELNPSGTIRVYWDWLFGRAVPFYTYHKLDEIVGRIEQSLDLWPDLSHTITAWWIDYKRDFAHKVINQLEGNDE